MVKSSSCLILATWLAVGPACTGPTPRSPSATPRGADSPPQAAATPALDTAAIDRTVGHAGAWNSDKTVYKVSVPRTDVTVAVEGRPLDPFMGLTSWAAFTAGSSAANMVMGDLVLFEDEVNPVMTAALDNGLAVTALHNHFFGDEPKVWFMHIGGEGGAEQLARGVRAALDAEGAVRARSKQPAPNESARDVPAVSAITAQPLEAILGAHGQSKSGAFKLAVGRTVRMACGCSAGADMGVNTWAAFAGSDEHALVDGDFLTFEGELQPVLKALRHGGIDVVAIHSHMEGEQPRAIFLHYWGVGPAAELAQVVRAALDAQRAAEVHT